MRVLLIAPDVPGITSEDEIRDISGMHRVHTLAGTVTLRNVHHATRDNDYDILHFISHNQPGTDRAILSRIPLSNGEFIDGPGLVELAQQAGPGSTAAGLFLNTCSSSYYAAYATRRGIPWAVYTTVEIYDATAWRAPLLFYTELFRQKARGHVDFYQAYQSLADDGLYGWAAARNEYQENLLSPVLEQLAEIRSELAQLRIERSEASKDLPQRRELRWLVAWVWMVMVLSVAGDVILIVLGWGR